MFTRRCPESLTTMQNTDKKTPYNLLTEKLNELKKAKDKHCAGGNESKYNKLLADLAKCKDMINDTSNDDEE
jgi:hypothetical protein